MRISASRYHAISLMSLSLMLLTACGGGSDNGTNPPSPAQPQVLTMLDPKFSQQGRFPLDLGPHGGSLKHITELADGKLLLVLNPLGEALSPVTSVPDPSAVLRGTQSRAAHVQLLRLMPDGHVDLNYGQQGRVDLRLLDSTTTGRIMVLPNGKVWLDLVTVEPCVDVDTPSGNPNTWLRTCTVDAGTPQARTAQQAHTTVFIDADGQPNADSIDLNQLVLEEATRYVGRYPHVTDLALNDVHTTLDHVWTASGSAYPQGGIFNWGIRRAKPLGSQLEADGSWTSACPRSDAGRFAVDAGGGLWTASSSTSASSSHDQGICLERVDAHQQSLWAQPIHVPLQDDATVEAVAVHAQQAHIAASSFDSNAWTLHTLKVNDNGTLVSSYGEQGIARTPLPGFITHVRFDTDGSAWVHSRNAERGQNHLQHLNAQGQLNLQLGNNGVLTLDGPAATSWLRLIDHQQRWLMLSGDPAANTASLLRIQGNAKP